MINNGIQDIKQKTKDRATQTTIQIVGELRYSEMDNISCSTFDIRWVTFLTIRTSSEMKILLDASACEENHIILTKHQTKRRSRRIEHGCLGIS